jgi:uncharacterized membrane protein YjgN (DUF898 family)
MTVPAHPPHEGPLALHWRQPVGLAGLAVLNFVLNILTVGLYQFWGKTEVRKRIWSSVRVGGEPLVYTGTGREMFVGFLIAFAVVVAPAILLPTIALVAIGEEAAGIAQLVVFAVLFVLFATAVWRAQRYRLRRTLWRGIHGSLDGHAAGYTWATLWTIPWRSMMLQRHLVARMRFGDARFTFEGSSGPLYLRFVLVWIVSAIAAVIGIGLVVIFSIAGASIPVPPGMVGSPVLGSPVYGQAVLAPVVLGQASTGAPVVALIGLAAIAGGLLLYGLVTAWYRAFQFNHFAACTRLGDVRFVGTMTGFGMLWLTLTNWALTIFTFGLLVPVAQARSARYAVTHLTVVEPAVAPVIAAASDDIDRTRGEGLAHAFDFDAI